MHVEAQAYCPFCNRDSNQVIMADGDKWVAWCQRCFRARFVEQDEMPPGLAGKPPP